MQQSIYDFRMMDIDGKPVEFSEYGNHVLLIVNVASKCGFTHQYEGLENIYKRYKDQGFTVLGFPANNFLRQEPGNNEEIKSFCTLKYNVTFPMFAKISVKGKNIDPLYSFLTEKKTNPRFFGNIKWNFTKFLIDKDGHIVDRFESKINPEDKQMVKRIEEELNKRI